MKYALVSQWKGCEVFMIMCLQTNENANEMSPGKLMKMLMKYALVS